MKYDKKQIQSPRKDPHSFFLGDLCNISGFFRAVLFFLVLKKNRCFVYIVQESCPKHDNLHFVSIDQVEELELFFQCLMSTLTFRSNIQQPFWFIPLLELNVPSKGKWTTTASGCRKRDPCGVVYI